MRTQFERQRRFADGSATGFTRQAQALSDVDGAMRRHRFPLAWRGADRIRDGYLLAHS
jgi:hypothetical protein